jgi:hypothetical protein
LRERLKRFEERFAEGAALRALRSALPGQRLRQNMLPLALPQAIDQASQFPIQRLG